MAQFVRSGPVACTKIVVSDGTPSWHSSAVGLPVCAPIRVGAQLPARSRSRSCTPSSPKHGPPAPSQVLTSTKELQMLICFRRTRGKLTGLAREAQCERISWSLRYCGSKRLAPRILGIPASGRLCGALRAQPAAARRGLAREHSSERRISAQRSCTQSLQRVCACELGWTD